MEFMLKATTKPIMLRNSAHVTHLYTLPPQHINIINTPTPPPFHITNTHTPLRRF